MAQAHYHACKGSKGKAIPKLPSAMAILLDPKIKLLNILTYKFHILKDYIIFIIFFDTTDSYFT